MIPLSHIKILPVMIVVAFLAFSVRLVDVASSGLPDFSGSAYAKAKTEPKAEEHAKEDKTHGDMEGSDTEHKSEEKSDKDHKKSTKDDHKSGKKKKAVSKWRDASDSDMDYTKVKMEFFDDLVTRRKNLDDRERQLITREALITAAEQELDRKYQEMNQLRKQIENLLEDQSEEEKRRIASLVKIYEGMKPKSAASIFNTLDLDVLTAVLSNMSERRLSPILALMSPERARTVTIILANQKKLPELPR